ELAALLDALQEANRQMVMADEQRPSTLPGLPERLRRRLGASVIVQLGAPDATTRTAILRHKVAFLGWGPLSDASIAVLAARVRGSVHDLETALGRLYIEAAARGGAATGALAAQVASEINRAARQPRGR